MPCPHYIHLVSRKAVPRVAEVYSSLFMSNLHSAAAFSLLKLSEFQSYTSPQHFQILKGTSKLGCFLSTTLECVEPCKNCPLAHLLGNALSYFIPLSVTTVPWWMQHFVPDSTFWKASGFCSLFSQGSQAPAWKIRDSPLVFLRVLSCSTSSVKARENEGNLIPPQDPGIVLTLGLSTLNLSPYLSPPRPERDGISFAGYLELLFSLWL